VADAATHWRRINSREGGCPTHEEIGFALRMDVPSDRKARHADEQALAMARARFN
jgi:hypothetical protein